MVQPSYDIRTVQDLLGHADVATTMNYAHVLNVGGGAVRSPIDSLNSSERRRGTGTTAWRRAVRSGGGVAPLEIWSPRRTTGHCGVAAIACELGIGRCGSACAGRARDLNAGKLTSNLGYRIADVHRRQWSTLCRLPFVLDRCQKAGIQRSMRRSVLRRNGSRPCQPGTWLCVGLSYIATANPSPCGPEIS